MKSDWLYSLQSKMENSIQSAKTNTRPNCGSDHELFIAKLKKVGETTRLFRYESESEITQSCPTLCDPMDCSLPGFSIHGILQARILEWVTILLSFKIKPDKLILASCMNSSQAKDDLYEFSFKILTF